MSEEKLAAALSTIQELQERLDKSELLVVEMSAVEDKLQALAEQQNGSIAELLKTNLALSEQIVVLKEDARLAIHGKEVALDGFINQQRMHSEQLAVANHFKRTHEQAERVIELLNKDDKENATVEAEKLLEMKREGAIKR